MNTLRITLEQLQKPYLYETFSHYYDYINQWEIIPYDLTGNYSFRMDSIFKLHRPDSIVPMCIIQATGRIEFETDDLSESAVSEAMFLFGKRLLLFTSLLLLETIQDSIHHDLLKMQENFVMSRIQEKIPDLKIPSDLSLRLSHL